MPIFTPPPDEPLRTDAPASFISKAFAFIGWFKTMVSEFTAFAASLSLVSTTDTSASSVAIGLGAKSFTVSTGKSFSPGMSLVIADAAAPSTNYMNAIITSYSGAALVVDVKALAGSGTKNNWVISQSGNLAIADATVTTAKLVDLNVTTNKLDDSAVITAKLADSSVATAKLAGSSVTTAKLAFDGGAFGSRNKIIGGDFTTNPWQRGTTFAAIADAAYSADRWQFRNTSAGVVSILKTADAPTASQAGVYSTHCLHVDVTTADASIAAGDLAALRHKVEGLNATSFGFGQSGARYVTLSFWHKHTKVGTHCVALRNSAANRSYVAEYTQVVTDTWELATLTIPVDTSGTWLYDTGIGLDVVFAMAAGSTYQTAANAWVAGDYWATSNQVNNLDNTANNFKINLVQLEFGQVPTPFEARSVGQELFLCQRYFEIIYYFMRLDVSGNASFAMAYNFIADKRVSPTLTIFRGAEAALGTAPAPTGGSIPTKGCYVITGGTAGVAVRLAEGYVTAAGEL